MSATDGYDRLALSLAVMDMTVMTRRRNGGKAMTYGNHDSDGLLPSIPSGRVEFAVVMGSRIRRASVLHLVCGSVFGAFVRVCGRKSKVTARLSGRAHADSRLYCG